MTQATTQKEIDAIIRQLTHAPEIILPLIRAVPEKRRKVRPAPGRWSAHEHACHLSVVHGVLEKRLEMMLSEEHPHVGGYDPDTDGVASPLMEMNLEDSLRQFAEDRTRLVDRLKQLTPKEWSKEGTHEEYSTYSVFIMFRHLTMHDMLHAYRIEESLLAS